MKDLRIIFLILYCVLISYVKSDEDFEKYGVNNVQRLSLPYINDKIPNKFDSEISKVFVVRSISDLLYLIRNQNNKFEINGFTEKNKLKNIFDVYLAWKSMNRESEINKSNKNINYGRKGTHSYQFNKEDTKFKISRNNSSRTPKTSISRFPPVLEYIVQRIQGFNSVYVVKDQSLWIYQTTPKPDVLDYEEVVYLENTESCKSIACNNARPGVQSITLIDEKPSKIETIPKNGTANGQLETLISVSDTTSKNISVGFVPGIDQTNITSNLGSFQIVKDNLNATSILTNVGQSTLLNDGTVGNISEFDRNSDVIIEPVIIHDANISSTIYTLDNGTLLSNSDKNATPNLTVPMENDTGNIHSSEVNKTNTMEYHQSINISDNVTLSNESNASKDTAEDSTKIPDDSAPAITSDKDTN